MNDMIYALPLLVPDEAPECTAVHDSNEANEGE